MKNLIITVLILNLNSCLMFKENGIEMTITNDSNETISNIEFSTTEHLEVIKIDEIQPKKTITKFLSMRNNKSDGAYWLTFKRESGKVESSDGGYYTNGGALDSWVNFTIKSDTTVVEFSGSKY